MKKINKLFFHLCKLALFCFAILFLSSFTSKSFQESEVVQKRISISLKNETMEQAIQILKNKYKIQFAYDPEDLQLNKRKVNEIIFTDVPLAQVLDKILYPHHILYKEVNKTIILYNDASSTLQFPLEITGKVTDVQNQPLIGVTILIKNTTIGTTTDTYGEFKIVVPESATKTLIFSYIGYKGKEVGIAGNQRLSVVLEEETSFLNEVVVVGYGEQKRTSLTSSVARLEGEQVRQAPVASISNSLGGRVSGVLSRQNSGEPGSDFDQLQIRGIGTTGNSAPLAIVDGIPYDLNQLNPNEIESITILKDAAAVAPYGLAGANGVILVTTKRGKEGKFSLNYDAFYGFQNPTRIPEFLDAHGYAKYFSLANENIGNNPTFTEEDLQKFKDGSDPDRYPNSDWVNDVLQKNSPINRHSLSLTGGSEKVRFFANMGYLYQEGVVAPINFRRYNLTANIDANVTSSTIVSLNLKGALTKDQSPSGQSGVAIFTNVTEIPPVLPMRFSNGLPGNALLPQIYESGYNRENENVLSARFQIEQKLPFLPGLALKGALTYNKDNSLRKVWRLPVTFYSLNAQNEFSPNLAGPPSPTLTQTYQEYQNIISQAYITYERQFGRHGINLLGVFEGQSGMINNMMASRINYSVLLDELSSGSSNKNDLDNSGFSEERKQLGWVYRMNYQYDEKYLVELTGRYDGHYYFAPGKRYAFFPAASLGWRISEESFIKNRFNWLDELKLRASYGRSGNLAGGPFQYLTSYSLNNSYVFGGTAPYQVQGVYENAQPNTNITWETSLKSNIGLDMSIWRGRLGLVVDVFKETRSDMLILPNSILPSEYGIGVSQVNAGKMENRGIEISLSSQQRFNNGLQLNASFNFSYARNELVQVFENESTFNNPNRRLTGKPLNTQFGLQSLGLYQINDFEEDGKTLKTGLPSPTFGPVAPGDIKYADLAGAPDEDGNITGPDGIIDIHDYSAIGNPLFPEIIFGLNMNASWKGVDLHMLWQGASNSSIYLQNETAVPFFNGAKIFKEQTDFWTPENTNASYPRLTPTPLTNNIQPSNFWMKDGTYLRLKTLEVGYSLPQALLDRIKSQRVRIFVSGQNLLTFSKLDFLDPELGNSRARYYFQQKVYAVGLNLGF